VQREQSCLKKYWLFKVPAYSFWSQWRHCKQYSEILLHIRSAPTNMLAKPLHTLLPTSYSLRNNWADLGLKQTLYKQQLVLINILFWLWFIIGLCVLPGHGETEVLIDFISEHYRSIFISLSAYKIKQTPS